jgi:hypothetical protein
LRLQPEENVLTADVQFAEPAGGLVADLLELRGRPAVSLALAGTGSLASWTADLQMQANGTQVLFGEIGLRKRRTDIGSPPILPVRWRPSRRRRIRVWSRAKAGSLSI